MSNQNTHGASESEENIVSNEEEVQPSEEPGDVVAEEAPQEELSDSAESEISDGEDAASQADGEGEPSNAVEVADEVDSVEASASEEYDGSFPSPRSFGVEGNRARSNGDDGVDGLPFDADHLWDPSENGEEFLGGSADTIIDDAQRDYYEYGDKMHTPRADTVDEAAAAAGRSRGKHGRHGKSKPTRKERLAAMPEHQRKSRRMRRVLVCVVLVLIVLLGAIVYLGYQFINTASEVNVQQGTSATTDVAQSSGKDASSGNTKVTDVPDLVSLLGLSRDDAIAKLGDGAVVTSVPTSEEEGSQAANITVMLTNEPSDSVSHSTPTVYLTTADDGTVTRAGYSAATASLGYGDLSFRDAVNSDHVIEKTLNEAGLNVVDGSVTLPEDSQYKTYATDGTTLVFEKCSFDGTSTVSGVTYTWSSVLSYDYTAANASGNLADTVRQITIYISAA